jgi:cysteine desulfurase
MMWANNETGVLFPVEWITEICRARGMLYHCEAVQAAGNVPIDVRKIPVHYLSPTGHKFFHKGQVVLACHCGKKMEAGYPR